MKAVRRLRRRSGFRKAGFSAALGCLGCLAFLGWLGLAPAACTATVQPPADPELPVTVYLRHEGRHTALLLPRTAGGWVEYGFGEYGWYAEENDRWYDVFDTMLWPTQGTLGRREVAGSSDADLRAAYPYSQLTPLAVDGRRVAQLEQQLAGEYAAARAAALHNANYELDFVEHDDGFWAFYNCHDAVAGWLEDLDCEVSSMPIRSGIVLAPEE